MKKLNHKKRGFTIGVPAKTRSGFVGCQLSLVLTLTALAMPQAGQAGWWKTFGGAENEIGNCIQITSDGNYIISCKKNDDVWLIKTDTSGNIIWDYVYSLGTSYGNVSRWVEETSDGGYIIAPSMPNLLKVNAQGDSLWAIDFGLWTYCTQETPEGNYVVVGDKNLAQCALVKTNSDGIELWTRLYEVEPRNENVGFFIQVTNDNGYIITGRTGTENEETESKALWLIKTDSNGDTLWTKEYGEWGQFEENTGRCVRETDDGGFIITGHKDFSERGVWLLKTDSLGDTLWTKTFSSAEGGTGFDVQQTHDGGYIIIGTTQSVLSTSINLAGADLWLIKTDSLGGTLWSRIYGGAGYDLGYCVRQVNDRGYLALGGTNSYGEGGADVYLLRTDSLGLLAIQENPTPERQKNWEAVVSLGHEIVLKYWNMPQGLNASVYDASGRQVDKIHQTGAKGSITWGTGHPSGVYFIQVRNDATTNNATKVILAR